MLSGGTKLGDYFVVLCVWQSRIWQFYSVLYKQDEGRAEECFTSLFNESRYLIHTSQSTWFSKHSCYIVLFIEAHYRLEIRRRFQGKISVAKNLSIHQAFVRVDMKTVST